MVTLPGRPIYSARKNKLAYNFFHAREEMSQWETLYLTKWKGRARVSDCLQAFINDLKMKTIDLL